MGEIPINDPKCNGWVLYESEFIVADDSKNIHVAECIIEDDNNGHRSVYLNSAQKTVCKRDLVAHDRRYLFASKDASEIRSKLTALQNAGKQVCGSCVAHFHVDPK